MSDPRAVPSAAALAEHLAAMTTLGAELAGHLTPREVRFLALAAAVPTASGDLLEIGSFLGKSTIILAKSAALAGAGAVAAVDPLLVTGPTDPKDADPASVATRFRDNLRAHGVEALVDFHQVTSAELGRSWDRPLRLLWIDGDHTCEGARIDFRAFAPHLAPGGIVALHDVLHRYEGPARVFSEEVLDSDAFGACGVWGSIGWGQFLGGPPPSATWKARKRALRERIAAMLPHAAAEPPYSPLNELLFKYHRARVPHGELQPEAWLHLVGVKA